MAGVVDQLQEGFARLGESVQRLIRVEIALAQAEMADKAKRFGKAGIYAGGAAVLAFFAVFGILIGAIWGLGELLPIWASALIVALLFLIGAGLLVKMAIGSAKKAGGPLPQAAIGNVQELPHDLKGAMDGAPTPGGANGAAATQERRA